MVDLASGEPERGQPIELRHHHEHVLAREEMREPRQVGLTTSCPRETMDEEQCAARPRRTVEINLQSRKPGGQRDVFSGNLIPQGGEPSLSARGSEGKRGCHK